MLRRITLAIALLTCSASCASTVKDYSREVVPGVVGGAVDGIADPTNQDKLAYNLQEDAVREATKRISAGVVDGAVDTLTHEERKRRLDAFAVELQGMTQRMVQSSVASAVEEALGEKTQGKIRGLLRGVLSDMVATLFTSISAQLGTPEERLEAIGKSAREISKQVTLGFQEAVDDTRIARERGQLSEDRGALLEAAGNIPKSSNVVAIGLGGALVLVVGALIAMFVMFSRRFKLHAAELEERDATLRLVSEAIKSTEKEPWAKDLQRVMRDRAADAQLSKLFRVKEARAAKLDQNHAH